VTLTLPYPPSANHYWKRCGHRYFIAPKGVAFRTQVMVACAASGVRPLSGLVSLAVTLTPGDERRRDIDNVLKPLLDALTHGGAWNDDSQVSRLVVERHAPLPKIKRKSQPGRCEVSVMEGWA